MFSQEWEDCREHALDRLNYVSEFGKVPSGWDGKCSNDFRWCVDNE